MNVTLFIHVYLFSFGKVGVNKSLVEVTRSLGYGEQQPYHKQDLDFIVKWQPANTAQKLSHT